MTQARLLDIAVREFGMHGLDGASTRRIAGLANTAMSSITYHYRGKEGLYLAAADHIAEQMGREMALALAAEDDVGEYDRDGARAAIHRLCQRFVDTMASDASIAASLSNTSTVGFSSPRSMPPTYERSTPASNASRSCET